MYCPDEGSCQISNQVRAQLMVVSPHSFHSSNSLNYPNATKPIQNSFKCMQINLRHAKAAAASLSVVTLENNLDIILIQEPYACNASSSTLVDIPLGYVAFHSLDRDHAYGAAIFIKTSLAISCRAVSRCLSNRFAAVDLHMCGRTFRFISMYVRPSCLHSSAEFRSAFHSLLSPLTVIGVDSNAKNSLWNSVCSDKKGVEFEGILLESKLNILNRQRCELDFIPGGTSFLDITLGTDDIVLPRWFFPAIPSLSDHPYIYFEILRSCQFNRARPARFSTTKLPLPILFLSSLPQLIKLRKIMRFHVQGICLGGAQNYVRCATKPGWHLNCGQLLKHLSIVAVIRAAKPTTKENCSMLRAVRGSICAQPILPAQKYSRPSNFFLANPTVLPFLPSSQSMARQSRIPKK